MSQLGPLRKKIETFKMTYKIKYWYLY